MEIKCIEDLKRVADEMHDSEFQGKDLCYNPEEKSFRIRSYSPDVPQKKFSLVLYNVEKYRPINLERIESGKAMGGVFNALQIRDDGHELILLSQDLKIVFYVSKIEGSFRSDSKESDE